MEEDPDLDVDIGKLKSTVTTIAVVVARFNPTVSAVTILFAGVLHIRRYMAA